jgi:hypothetical protein
LFFVDSPAVFLGATAVSPRRWEFVWQWNIARGAEVTDVGAVLVFDAEQGPHASPEHLRESYEEGRQSRVLELEVKNGIEDPVEAQDGVDHYSDVVHPYFLIA